MCLICSETDSDSAPVLTIAKMIPGTLVYVVILVFAAKGCRAGSRNRKVFWILVGSLAVYEILESLLNGDFNVLKADLLLLVYALYMAVAYVCLWKQGASCSASQTVETKKKTGVSEDR